MGVSRKRVATAIINAQPIGDPRLPSYWLEMRRDDLSKTDRRHNDACFDFCSYSRLVR
jgi:hypothetical protein